MNNKKYKLTISVLASNRKDTLPKTLASLKPILDNVSSELIVVDTGCDEDLLEIVRQYTDKIEKFQWCNDFAKARNVGIDKAQGDWFMFIDDDEWFEDVTEFIDFFNSDEMKRYNYGKYLVRNYENMEGTAWTDSVAGRMFRLFEGTKFIDAIHERPTNIAGPTKDFTAYAHHYGYVYKTEADRRAHLNRNLTLLLEQVKREPGIARHYGHLVQEYCTVKEYEKVLEYASEGIQNADMSIDENRKDIVGLYGAVVWTMLNQAKYEEVVEKTEELLKSPYMNELGSLSLACFAAVAAYKLKKYEDALKYVDMYFRYFDFFEKKPEERYKQDAIVIMNAPLEENCIRAAITGMVSAIALQDANRLYTYVKRYDFSKKMTLPDENENIEKLVEMMISSDSSRMLSIVKHISGDKRILSDIITAIEKLKQQDMGRFLQAADFMAQTDINNGYVYYLKIASNRNNEDIHELTALYGEMIEKVTDLINVDHDFWQIAHIRGINIKAMVEKTPLDRWMSTVDAWSEHIKIKELVEKKNDLMNNIYPEGMHMKYFDVVTSEAFMLRKKLDGATVGALKEEMLRFATTTLEFYREIYREEIFTQYTSILPKKCQAALHIVNICGRRENVWDTETENQLRAVVRLIPAMERIVDKYRKLLYNAT